MPLSTPSVSYLYCCTQILAMNAHCPKGKKVFLVKVPVFLYTERKKWSHFDLKSGVTGGTKIWPGFPSNWKIFESNWLDIESQFQRPGIPSNCRIFESNWLDIESQFDSNILQLLGIPGQILVPPVTPLFRSKWLNFFQCIFDLKTYLQRHLS